MNRAAFTLVELSIVLVILGLLVGGVLSGQSLIHAAELRSIGAEKDRYLTALNAFRDKYHALPGDMPNAFAFWGSACGTDSMAANTGCNGNGDGTITTFDDDSSIAINEQFKVWAHLSRAGLVEGSYDGITINNGDGDVIAPNNAPRSKYPQGYWMFSLSPYDGIGRNPLTETHSNWLNLGIGATLPASSEPFWLHGLLTRNDAWNLDKKSDDGFAQSGTVRGSYDNGSLNCWDSANDPYSIAAEGGDIPAQCMLGFIYRK